MSDTNLNSTTQPNSTNPHSPEIPDNSRQFPISSENSAENALHNLPDRRLRAIDMIVRGCRFRDIAAELLIDTKTLYNWRTHDPAFKAALQLRRTEIYEHAADRFRAIVDEALDVLAIQIKTDWEPTSHRASRSVLALSQIGKTFNPAPLPQRDLNAM